MGVAWPPPWGREASAENDSEPGIVQGAAPALRRTRRRKDTDRHRRSARSLALPPHQGNPRHQEPKRSGVGPTPYLSHSSARHHHGAPPHAACLLPHPPLICRPMESTEGDIRVGGREIAQWLVAS